MSVLYWVGVASSDHVEMGVEGGFAQLGHGKHMPVKRLSPGDWIVYYSPRTALKGGEPVKSFTAIGRVREGEAYQANQAPGFSPFRRDIDFEKAAHWVPIAPLLEELSFTKGRGRHWGIVLRRGSFQISECDFTKIAAAMGVKRTA